MNRSYIYIPYIGKFSIPKKYCQSLPTMKIIQAKYLFDEIIRFVSHVYISSKGHSDET